MTSRWKNQDVVRKASVTETRKDIKRITSETMNALVGDVLVYVEESRLKAVGKMMKLFISYD